MNVKKVGLLFIITLILLVARFMYTPTEYQTLLLCCLILVGAMIILSFWMFSGERFREEMRFCGVTSIILGIISLGTIPSFAIYDGFTRLFYAFEAGTLGIIYLAAGGLLIWFYRSRRT